jgi:hypothetical protein
MPIFFPPTDLKPGDVLLAERLSAIEEELRRLGTIKGGAGVSVRHTKSGLQVTGQGQVDRYAAVATSDFAPRSGTTVSSGSVEIWYLQDSGAGTIADAGITLPVVWCISSSTMTSGHAIDSGQYCTVYQDPFGIWWASPEECS